MSCGCTSNSTHFPKSQSLGFIQKRISWLGMKKTKPNITRIHQSEEMYYNTNTHTHTHTLCPELPGWAGTRKVKPIWILLKQETVSGSGISWATCKSAPRSRHITKPALHHSVFYRLDALPAAQPTVSKHWRQILQHKINKKLKPGLVAFYDIWPGNRAGLFLKGKDKGGDK